MIHRYKFASLYTLTLFLVLAPAGKSWAAEPTAAPRPGASSPVRQQMQQQPTVMAETGTWVVPSGASLQDVLYQWCQQAGWSLVWNSEYAYTTQAGTTFKGNFLDAVKDLFGAMDTAVPHMYPVIYKGNKVVVVKNTTSR